MNRQGTFIADWIDRSRRSIAIGAVGRHQDRAPTQVEAYGRAGFDDLVADTEIRLQYLAEALAAGRSALFLDHLAWLKVSLAARGLSVDLVTANLACLREELEASLPPAEARFTVEFLDEALDGLEHAAAESDSLLADDQPQVDLARHYLLATLEGRPGDALNLLRKAMADGAPAEELCENVVQRVQAELGRMWQVGEIHSAEEHAASRIAERAINLLQDSSPIESNGRTALVASVGGNSHDLGSRMVAGALESEGWRVVLLGANTPSADLARSVIDYSADLVALSASLTLHLRSTAEVITTIRSLPSRSAVPILVGGRPFQIVPDLSQIVGADGSAKSARQAAIEAERLLVS